MFSEKIGFREEEFCGFFSYIVLYKQMISWGMANLNPRGLIGRIYVEDHKTLLYTKYISCAPHGFREEEFLSFSYYKSVGVNDPRGMANFDPRGTVGRIYVGDHKTLLHTKYIGCGPHDFREDFFSYYVYGS